MHPELGGDLGGGQPPGAAEMLGQARNPVGLPDVPDHAGGGTAVRSRSGATRPLSVSAICRSVCSVGQRADHLDDRRRRAPQIGRAERERAFERRRRPALPANLDLDRARRGAAVTSSISSRSIRLRSRIGVRGSCHTRGRSLASAVNARAIVGGELARRRPGRGAPILLLGVGQPRQLLVPLSFEGVGDQPMFGAHQHETGAGPAPPPRARARPARAAADRPRPCAPGARRRPRAPRRAPPASPRRGRPGPPRHRAPCRGCV